ncbi:MAG: MG2 domain-containing protein [Luteolibacter sp.]
MKNPLLPCLLALMAVLPAWSAPRLVVSTPSLLPESKIDVIFDQPMVEQDDLGKEVANELFTTTPGLPGKLFWKAPTIAEFRPETIPSIGTQYRFSMGKGLKHLDGTEVAAGEFAMVSSEAFRILTSTIPNRWSSDYSRSTTSWMIVFNDDVDADSVAGFFTFSSDRNGRVAPKVVHATAEQAGYYRTSYLTWKYRTDPEKQRANVEPESFVKNILIVTPDSPLPVAKNWALQVLKGLPNADETGRLSGDLSYTIGEVEPFRFDAIYAQVSADSPRSILLAFNERLPDEFDGSAVTVSPEPEGMAVSTDGKALRIAGDFSEHNKYTVTLAKGIVSSEGQNLSNSGSHELEFERLEPELALPSEDEAQLAFGKREYEISTINLASVKIRIKKLEGKGAVRAFQGYRNYTGMGPNYTQIEPVSVLPYSLVPGVTILEKEIVLGTDVDTGKTLTLSWDELLPEGMDFASLFIDVTGTPHPMAEAEGGRNAQAIVQLTDIGLAWKFTDTTSLVYAFSCKTGKPLPGVKIDVRGEDANLLEEAVTGEDGMATVVRNADVRHVQAVLGDDSYTAAFDETLDSVGLWHFPVRYSWMKQQSQQRRAFMFTERSLYRPGEKVRIKGIVRNQFGNAIGLAEQKPARIVIIDPQDKEIFTQAVELSALGSFDLSYTLPDSTTGGHTIRLEFPEELEAAEKSEDWEVQEALLQSASFEVPLRVEEFRRNTFEVLQEIKDPAIGATEVFANLTATYYQGQPVAAGKASTFTEITEINPYPERYRDFLFGNHRRDDWRYWYHYFGYRDRDGENGITGTSFDSENVLSPEGFAEIPVQIPQNEFPTTRQVSIATEVTDANNQTLTARSTATVHPASLYAGISRVDRLIRVGDEAPFRIVVTDTEGEPATQDVTLTATLTREVHTTTKTTNANGDTVTESEPTEEEVSTAEIVVTAADSAKEGLSFPVAPLNTGLHFLTVKGKDTEGREFATVTRIHVYGAKEYPWAYEDGLRIKLVSEKKSYKPGETARILVLSPIEGTALVTVEREKILSSRLVELKADNPVIEIPLTDDHAPNAYVSILIVKGSAESAREIKEPQLRLGYCELQVENLRDRLEVAIDDPSGSSRPGTEVTLSGAVKTSDGSPAVGAEVTLYAVDEGTLAVMGYDTPDPMAYFYDRRYLHVNAGTSFQDFITENPEYRSFHNKGFFIGGGGDPSKLADLFRKNFDPCAAWSPTLATDAEGRFSDSFTLPDTLTRYRVIAIVHHTGASFGNDVSELIVKKPLMLEPKLPRFVHQGDLITGNVMVQNASDYTATWEITCSISGGEGTPPATIEGASAQSLTLAPGESKVLGFPFRVVDTGAVTVSYRATPLSLQGGELTPDLDASLSDAVQETFTSHYPMPLLRQVTAVRTQPGKTTDLHDLLSKELQTANGSVELEFATSPLVEITASADYLLQYPYGCAEQTSSSLMPWFAVKNLRPYVPAFTKRSDAEVEKAINVGVGRLLSMQLPNGSFGYWPGATDTNDWVTPYAGMVLTLASQNGGNVPPSALDSLAQYLIGTLRGAGEEKNSFALEQHARSLYTLALLGKAQVPYHSLMAEKLPFMSDTARALLAAAMAVGSEGRPQVLAAANGILSSKTAFQENSDGNYWSPSGSALPAVLIARLAIDPDSKEVHATLDRLLNDRNPYGHWRSTWMNGWSMLAVAQYASHQSVEKADAELIVNIDGESRKISLTPDSPTAALSFPLTAATQMTVTSESSAYVRMKISGKPAIMPLTPVAKNGLSIDRFYEKVLPSGQTEVLKQPALGDLIRVTLRVTLPEDDSRYVVVDDPLPSIFETVNTDFSSQSGGQNIRTSENDWTVSHSELRSDRAVFFVDRVWRKGTYEITYLARCTIPGDVNVPPAKVESMYDPENFALSASAKFSAPPAE